MTLAHASAPTDPAVLAAALEEVRTRVPLVQCLTNVVTTNLVANALLSVGGSPAMVAVPEEAGIFAGITDGVLVNLGTAGAEQREAMVEAVAAARTAGTPWVLDPVAVGTLPVRTALAARLVTEEPAIIRGNASEIRALAGLSAGGRGADSVDSADDSHEAATTLARSTGAVVAVSGAVDLVTDGERVVRVATGSPLLTKVTGAGCALGGITAAFAAVVEDRLVAAVAATTVLTLAAERSARTAEHPGSFAVGLLDGLHALTAQDVRDQAKVR